MEPRSDRAVDRQMLRPGPLGLLLARRALPVRDAAAGAPRRRDLRHAAADRGMAACACGAPPRLSQPPRDLPVAIPRALEPRSAGLGLARSGLGLWPQSIFHAARCAPRRTPADSAVSARTLARPCRRGWCLRLASAIDARGSLRPRRDQLRHGLCHDVL